MVLLLWKKGYAVSETKTFISIFRKKKRKGSHSQEAKLQLISGGKHHAQRCCLQVDTRFRLYFLERSSFHLRNSSLRDGNGNGNFLAWSSLAWLMHWGGRERLEQQQHAVVSPRYITFNIQEFDQDIGYKWPTISSSFPILSMVLLDAIALHFCIVRASMLTRWPAAATSIWNFWNQNTN